MKVKTISRVMLVIRVPEASGIGSVARLEDSSIASPA